MNSSLKAFWSMERRFFKTFNFLALFLLLVSYGSAQLQSPTPSPAVTSTATISPTVTPTATVTPNVEEQTDQDLARLRAIQEEARRDKLASYNWYYVLVSLMFFAVLVPFVLAIYRGTSGSPATNNRPLGLPVGSFRSILAYSLVAYLGFYVLTSILSVSLFAPPDFLLGIVATVIGFYFGSRAGGDEETSTKTGTVRGIVRQGTFPARGALIRFRRTDDNTVPYSRLSDLDGRFELRGAKPGGYIVSASLTGAQPSPDQEISVAEGSDHEIEINIGNVTSPPLDFP